MKTPRTLQEYFENPTQAEKDVLMNMRLALVKDKVKSSKKNPFERK